jgi:hypothetical protein
VGRDIGVTLDETIAREAIRRTIGGYTHAGDTRDAALFESLWAEDAYFEFKGFPPVPGFRCEGLQGIRAWTAGWGKFRETPDPSVRAATFARHNLTTCQIDFTGPDTAKARTFFMVVTDIGLDHAGVYDDRFVCQGEDWLFSFRQVTLDWRSEDSIYPALPKR